MSTDPYTDPDMIEALYKDPESETLMLEYALATGSIQMGLTPASGIGASGIVRQEVIVDLDPIPRGKYGELPIDTENPWDPELP